jgi:hypothetical protein
VLLDAAREAFTQGSNVAALAAAAVTISTAVLAALLLRRTGAGSQSEEAVVTDVEGAVEAACP